MKAGKTWSINRNLHLDLLHNPGELEKLQKPKLTSPTKQTIIGYICLNPLLPFSNTLPPKSTHNWAEQNISF